MQNHDDANDPERMDLEEEMRENEAEQPARGRRGDSERRERETFRRPTNAKELMLEELPRRAQRADEKLRAHLTGKIMVRLNGRGDRYVFDWTGSDASVSETKDTNADCTIELSEDNLMRIASGELNPQIGMLSSKISISGRPEFAVYFFNLIAPQQAH